MEFLPFSSPVSLLYLFYVSCVLLSTCRGLCVYVYPFSSFLFSVCVLILVVVLREVLAVEVL